MQAKNQGLEWEVKNSLINMGYPSNVVENAYASSQIKTTEGVLNFLDAHPELTEAWILGKPAPEPYFG